jgi:DNA-binding NtrC family response regulator
MLLRVVLAVGGGQLDRRLRRHLALADVLVESVRGGGGGWNELMERGGDVVVLGPGVVPEPVSSNIRFLRQLPDRPGIVLLTEREDSQERANYLAAGCDAVLSCALPVDLLRQVLMPILDDKRQILLADFREREVSPQARLRDFVSRSAAMQVFMSVVNRVAKSEVGLLIQGETGVGKERLARAIHAEGAQSQGPFVAVNCGALAESLLESELFGHEQGAFTGATRRRRGCFELAHQGTIFLDEISEMPLHLQVKLLRVLQEHEVAPLGGERAIPVKVRVMASTNRDLAQEVEKGRFRKDLYYRLSVVVLTIPALRERREDIPVLVESYVQYFRPRIGGGAFAITAEAMEALSRYDWPGNVRELMNVVERAMLLSNREEITVRDLPEVFSRGVVSEAVEAGWGGVDGTWEASALVDCARRWREVREEMLGRLEERYFQEMLRETQGRVGEAARRAGIGVRSLHTKMRRHGLMKEDYR